MASFYKPKARFQDALNKAALQSLLNEWDKASTSVRSTILKDFCNVYVGRTALEIDDGLARGGSLLLTRIGAWLRLTYLMNNAAPLQMAAITVLVTATGGHRFLVEFLEVGGVLTLLEVINTHQTSAESKVVALQLLMRIAMSGRRYKDVVCASEGIPYVASCMSKAHHVSVLVAARDCLFELALSGEANRHQVSSLWLDMLAPPAASVALRRACAQGLCRLLQDGVLPSAWQHDAIFVLFDTADVGMQFEGTELLKTLAKSDSFLSRIVGQMVVNLQTTGAPLPGAENDIAVSKMAAFTRLLTHLLTERAEPTLKALQGSSILVSLARMLSQILRPDMQAQALATLQALLVVAPTAEPYLVLALGVALTSKLQTWPQSMSLALDALQTELLATAVIPLL